MKHPVYNTRNTPVGNQPLTLPSEYPSLEADLKEVTSILESRTYCCKHVLQPQYWHYGRQGTTTNDTQGKHSAIIYDVARKHAFPVSPKRCGLSPPPQTDGAAKRLLPQLPPFYGSPVLYGCISVSLKTSLHRQLALASTRSKSTRSHHISSLTVNGA